MGCINDVFSTASPTILQRATYYTYLKISTIVMPQQVYGETGRDPLGKKRERNLEGREGC
jgi:hypothetical protein